MASLDPSIPVAKLVDLAADQFGCSQIDGAEVRTRLGFMADAGLVERIDWSRYRVTLLGQKFLDELLLEDPILKDESADDFPQGTSSSDSRPAGGILDEVSVDLRRFSHLSDASTEFELAVAKAFELFGFRSEHLGGSGRTDVLITAELSAADRYRSIIDAKASASGIIGDNAIKFDALKDHIKRHQADFGMVVGPGFTGRVRDWAANNKFVLLTVDELIGLIERHQRAPLTLLDLKGLFENPESDLTEIDELYDAASHISIVLRRIVDMLYQEANEEDPIAGGHMSLENLHYAVRKEVSPRPSKELINDTLQLLASSLIKAVATSKDTGGEKYKLVDSPSNIMRRLSGLGLGLDKLVVDNINGRV